MRLLKENAQIAPSTFFATLVNAPCSSILLTSASEDSTVYLVVGKSNGETVFFPTDRSECISKITSDVVVPITALVAGDLRNVGKKEVVTVTSNGILQSLNYPNGKPPSPSKIFFQQIYANVCFADILDIDNDGLQEFLIAMTDRIVRTYRYCNKTERLIPLNKWEMPSHISSCCIGLGRENYVLCSQYDRDQYVQLDFEDSIKIYERKCLKSTKDAKTQLVVALLPHSTIMFHSLAERILIVDKNSTVQTELNCIESGIICASTVTLSSGLTILVTVDPWGQMVLYGWSDKNVLNNRNPIAHCNVSRDVDYMCAYPSLQSFCIIVSTVNIYNRIAIFSIDLSLIISD